MSLALLYGAASGAVHAVTGPDHLLSLGPVAMRQTKAPWRVGLSWGSGHALGTLVLALPALFLAEFAPLPNLAAWSDRIAGFALLALAAWSLHGLRKAARGGSDLSERSPRVVGFVHGLTGAASLLMMAPMIVAGSWPRTIAFLIAFAIGSTLAMGALTSAIARIGARLRANVIERAQKVMLGAAALFGVVLAFG